MRILPIDSHDRSVSVEMDDEMFAVCADTGRIVARGTVPDVQISAIGSNWVAAADNVMPLLPKLEQPK